MLLRFCGLQLNSRGTRGFCCLLLRAGFVLFDSKKLCSLTNKPVCVGTVGVQRQRTGGGRICKLNVKGRDSASASQALGQRRRADVIALFAAPCCCSVFTLAAKQRVHVQHEPWHLHRPRP